MRHGRRSRVATLLVAIALSIPLVVSDRAAAQGPGQKPAPKPGPMLDRGTFAVEAPDFRLTLVRTSQTVAALEPKAAAGFDFTPGDRLVERSRDGYYHLGDLDLRVRRQGAAEWTSYSTAQVRRPVTALRVSSPVLAAADLTPTLPADVPLKVTRTWLVDEKRFLREAIHAGVPVLGICLGAQLIASALGARVYPGPHKEIGWFDIDGVADPEGVFDFPERMQVFHWHGETFDLPPGAVPLARSAACKHQAFRIGHRVLALQFHLETTAESLDALVTNCRDELVDGTDIQTEDRLRAAPAEAFVTINRMMAALLDRLTTA